jgi:hypothetical protein
MTNEEEDFEDAFRKIEKNLVDHQDCQDRSVISITGRSEESAKHDDDKKDPVLQTRFELPMQSLLNMGVPIVLAAGNWATDTKRQKIDSRPQIYETNPNMPLINVGAASYKGERIKMSQVTPGRTMLYAPGENVVGTGQKGFFDSDPIPGTSVGT